jgi:glycosyltransferase involved in cell wall biosynthesis
MTTADPDVKRQYRAVRAEPAVLLVLPNLALGGAEVRTVALARRLDAAGVAVSLLSLRRSAGSPLQGRLGSVPLLEAVTREGRARLRRLDGVRVVHSAMTSAGLGAQALRAILGGQVAHVHSFTNALRPNRSGCRSARDRVATVADALLVTRADIVHAVSSDVGAQLVARHPRLAYKIHVMADLDAHAAAGEPSEALSRPEIRAAGLRLLSIGRLTVHKHQDVALDALPAILARRPDAHLVVVGCGPDRERLQRRALALGVQSQVTFIGASEAPAAFLEWADVLVHTSSHEGLSRACLEASRQGVTVLAANTPAGREHAHHFGDTCLIAPQHALALARAVLGAQPRRPTPPDAIDGDALSGYLDMYRRAATRAA